MIGNFDTDAIQIQHFNKQMLHDLKKMKMKKNERKENISQVDVIVYEKKNETGKEHLNAYQKNDYTS